MRWFQQNALCDSFVVGWYCIPKMESSDCTSLTCLIFNFWWSLCYLLWSPESLQKNTKSNDKLLNLRHKHYLFPFLLYIKAINIQKKKRQVSAVFNGTVALVKAHVHSTWSLTGISTKLTLKQYLCKNLLLFNLEGGISATSFLHSSFLKAPNAVMLCSIFAHKHHSTFVLPSCEPVMMSTQLASLSACLLFSFILTTIRKIGWVWNERPLHFIKDNMNSCVKTVILSDWLHTNKYYKNNKNNIATNILKNPLHSC